MRNNKSNQKGAIVVATLLGLSWLALGLTVAKTGEVAYEKVETDKIATQLKEQAQYLAKQAPNLGKSGDLAVQESMRLNQVSKDIQKEGLRSYSSDLLKEGVGLSLGTVLGTAGKVGEAVGHVMNIMGIKDNIMGATSGEVDISESDLKFWETLKGSRDNINDFELARRKAEVDEIARMKGEIKDSGKEIQELIGRQKQADQYWEQMKARAEQRSHDRLEALKNPEVQKELKNFVSTKNNSDNSNQTPAPTSKPTPAPMPTPASINDSSSSGGTSGEEVCSPSWACSNWSTCSGGKQSRSCRDSSKCGNDKGKPAMSQSCEKEKEEEKIDDEGSGENSWEARNKIIEDGCRGYAGPEGSNSYTSLYYANCVNHAGYGYFR